MRQPPTYLDSTHHGTARPYEFAVATGPFIEKSFVIALTSSQREDLSKEGSIRKNAGKTAGTVPQVECGQGNMERKTCSSSSCSLDTVFDKHLHKIQRQGTKSCQFQLGAIVDTLEHTELCKTKI